jgi:hypothetical protein
VSMAVWQVRVAISQASVAVWQVPVAVRRPG